jgi:hypothetical protein
MEESTGKWFRDGVLLPDAYRKNRLVVPKEVTSGNGRDRSSMIFIASNFFTAV